MKACVDEAGKVANAMKDLAQGVKRCATGEQASVGWSQVTWLMPPGHPTLTLHELLERRRLLPEQKAARRAARAARAPPPPPPPPLATASASHDAIVAAPVASAPVASAPVSLPLERARALTYEAIETFALVASARDEVLYEALVVFIVCQLHKYARYSEMEPAKQFFGLVDEITAKRREKARTKLCCTLSQNQLGIVTSEVEKIKKMGGDEAAT